MISLISVTCPSCSAKLHVAEGKKEVYCNYCGVKVIINNENEHVERYIDEAEVVKANINKELELKRMELEEKREKRNILVEAVRYAVGIILVIVMWYFIWNL